MGRGGGWMAWVGEVMGGGGNGVGEGRVRATRYGALLLTGNSAPYRWTLWLFIDPCSSFLCQF